jgi:hypothetical protein
MLIQYTLTVAFNGCQTLSGIARAAWSAEDAEPSWRPSPDVLEDAKRWPSARYPASRASPWRRKLRVNPNQLKQVHASRVVGNLDLEPPHRDQGPLSFSMEKLP